VPQEQAEDVAAAVSFLCSRADVDRSRIGLIGWGLGGGIAVTAAADDDRVAAVAAVNSVSDGRRTTRRLHTDDSWARLTDEIAEDRLHRACSGRSRLVSPFHALPMDEITTGYVDDELYKAPGFGSAVTLEAIDFLLRFRGESHALFGAAGQEKELVLLEGVGHTEWMFDDHPVYKRLEQVLGEFFARALAPTTTS
jgi:hypothetical protein